jgi:hypothetical protein
LNGGNEMNLDFLKKWKWAIIKLLILAYAAILGGIPPGQLYFSSSKLPECLLIFFASTLIVFVLLAVQVINPYGNLKWKRPLLNSNPLTMREPLQGFHFASIFFLISGIRSLLIAILRKQGTLEGARLLSMGIGLWIGVLLSRLVFYKKISHNQSPSEQSIVNKDPGK